MGEKLFEREIQLAMQLSSKECPDNTQRKEYPNNSQRKEYPDNSQLNHEDEDDDSSDDDSKSEDKSEDMNYQKTSPKIPKALHRRKKIRKDSQYPSPKKQFLKPSNQDLQSQSPS